MSHSTLAPERFRNRSTVTPDLARVRATRALGTGSREQGGEQGAGRRTSTGGYQNQKVRNAREQCSQACGRPAATVVVTVNGWILDVCNPCGRAACDPLLHGRPDDLALARRPKNDLERLCLWFDRHVSVDANGCWLWTGARFRGGYAAVGYGGSTRCAHRVIYKLMIADIPDELDLDHLCRVRHCVNPYHLEPVSRGENIRRGAAPNGVLNPGTYRKGGGRRKVNIND